VRELKNVVTRAVLFSAGSLIREEDLAFTQYPSFPPQSNLVTGEGTPASRPSAVQLKELLDSEGGNVSALSRRLQVCSKTIYRWLRTYRIDLMGIREVAVVWGIPFSVFGLQF
jgi:DNA-binding NtrC family response regulator